MREPRDVRMRGFRERADLDAVVRWVDGLAEAQRTETVPIDEAAGRVLARPLVSDVAVPAFARAAMDGWALRGEETFGAGEANPVAFRIVGTSLPGRHFEGRVGPGEAVRITTGAAVPHGADAVLPAEEGEERGPALTARGSVAPRRHVGAPGEDVAAGASVLPAGRRLRAQDVGLAASLGLDALEVLRRPRVSIVPTGNELLPPGRRPEGDRIVDSNTPMLRALIRRDGGDPVGGAIVPDDESAVRAALDGANGDVVLVTGGSSVGVEDHAPGVLAGLGTLAFHGVAMRPASPTGAGRIGERTVFLLPGNPVSCLSAYDLLAGRLVRRLAGRPPGLPYPRTRARLARNVSSVLGRVDYVRVRLEDGRAEPVMTRGASILSSTTEADGFLLVPAPSEGHPAGAQVEVWLY